MWNCYLLLLFCCWVMSSFLWPQGLQHARPPCPSPSPRVCTNSCPLSEWCYLTISSSVIPFSSCLQSFPASGSFPVSQLFTSGGQSIGASVSASVLPVNIQGWFPLRLTGSHGLVQGLSASTLLTLGVDSCGRLPCGMAASPASTHQKPAALPKLWQPQMSSDTSSCPPGEGSKDCSWLKPTILIQ